MLTHPDPVIQSLFDDICEQRDRAMVLVANMRVAIKTKDEEIARLKAGLNVVIEDSATGTDPSPEKPAT